MWILILFFLSGDPSSVKWFPSEFSCHDTGDDFIYNGMYGREQRPVRYECKEVKDWRHFHG